MPVTTLLRLAPIESSTTFTFTVQAAEAQRKDSSIATAIDDNQKSQLYLHSCITMQSSAVMPATLGPTPTDP